MFRIEVKIPPRTKVGKVFSYFKDKFFGTGDDALFAQWANEYFTWVGERYDRNSQNAGEWPALSPTTLAKRKARGNASTLILKDTGTIRGTLYPEVMGQGQLREQIPGGIRVGIGSSANHPRSATKSITEIASYHQSGAAPRLPKRTIIEPPPEEIGQKMADKLGQVIVEIINDAS